MQLKTYAARGILAAVVLSVIGVGVRAADQTKAMADQDAMMKQMEKYGTPGAEHHVLDPLVGTFNATIKGWMKPGDKPTESAGTSQRAWILDGRFLKEEHHGTWGGKPFEGLGLTGYDKVRAQYESVWLDNMGTGLMKVVGSYDVASKTLKESGTMSCPMTLEKNLPYRSELIIKDQNTSIYRSYTKGPDGKEFMGMEIVYKRVP